MLVWSKEYLNGGRRFLPVIVNSVMMEPTAEAASLIKYLLGRVGNKYGVLLYDFAAWASNHPSHPVPLAVGRLC